MELSNSTIKVLTEITQALQDFTPSYLIEHAKARAEALKLTEPEKKKRDECVATINSVNGKLEELKQAQSAYDVRLMEITKMQKKLDENKSSLDAREERHSAAVSAFNTKQISVTDNEKRLLTWQAQLEATARNQKATEERLKAWEIELNEQANNFEQAAIKVIGRKNK